MKGVSFAYKYFQTCIILCNLFSGCTYSVSPLFTVPSMFLSSVQLWWFFLLQSVVESGGCEHGRKGDLMKRAESLVSTRFFIIAILNFRFHFCNLNFCQRSAPQPSWTADGKWKERGSTAGPVQVDYIISCYSYIIHHKIILIRQNRNTEQDLGKKYVW